MVFAQTGSCFVKVSRKQDIQASNQQPIIMSNTFKKIDNQVGHALNELYELDLKRVGEFQWLTHILSDNLLPDSLVEVVFVKSTSRYIKLEMKMDNTLAQLIAVKHLASDVNLEDIQQYAWFDTEMDCQCDNIEKMHKQLR